MADSPAVINRIKGLPFWGIDPRLHTTGNTFWVGSGTGVNDSANGGSPDIPFATIDYAVGKCTASNNDVIYVLPGHTETITATAVCALDVAGISIVGLGNAANRPLITVGTAAANEINVTAANILFKNIQLVSGVDSLENFFNVAANGFTLEDCKLYTANTLEAVCFINLVTTYDDLTIRNCTFLQPTDPAGTDAAAGTGLLYCVDSENILIEGCYARGNFETSIIHNKTTKVQGLWIRDCSFIQELSGAETLTLVAASTGGMTGTLSTESALFFYGSADVAEANVKDFGAVGDGVTDDTTAIQDAINALSSTGGIINFGPKTYSIKNTSGGYALTATSNIKLQGVAGKSTLKLSSVAANSAMFGSDSAITNIEIDGIIFDGNKSAVTSHDTYGVKFENINNLTVTNSQFKNLRLDGILCGLTTLAEDVTVDNCLFTDIGVTGVGANGIRVYHNKGLTVNNCRFYGFITSSIDSNPTPGTDAETYLSITNNYIYNDSANWLTGHSSISLLLDRVLCQGNTIIGGGQIVVYAFIGGYATRDYRIIGNSILNGVATGIVVNQGENSDIVVSNNTIKGCYGSSILVLNPNAPPYSVTNPVIISNNIIVDNNSNTTYTWTNQPACILLGHANNVLVTGNQCIEPRFAGVYSAGSSDVVIENNYIVDQKGYAPTDLTTFKGGGIVVAPGGLSYTTSVNNVMINGNFVYNFLTTLSGSPSANIRVGGISVFNTDSPAHRVSNVTITNNMVNQGYGIGIQTYTLESVYINGNYIANTVGTLVDTASVYRLANGLIGANSAAPTTGTWERGSVVYNSAPSSAGYVGWVCTAAGTPGTWKTFGLIS